MRYLYSSAFVCGKDKKKNIVKIFLISNFRRVLNLNVCILLGISPASD